MNIINFYNLLGLQLVSLYFIATSDHHPLPWLCIYNGFVQPWKCAIIFNISDQIQIIIYTVKLAPNLYFLQYHLFQD